MEDKKFVPYSEFGLHHPFCNFYRRPREGCKMCDRLFKEYPQKENEENVELLHRYFPDVILKE